MILKDKEKNEEWIRCQDLNALSLRQCIVVCTGDEECKDNCMAEFEKQLLNCPCEVIIEPEKSNFQIERSFTYF